MTYEYDTLNRLLVQKTVDSTGELIAQYSYTLGKNGERTEVNERTQLGETKVDYTYDAANRLTEEKTKQTSTDGKESVTIYAYTYDKVGNRITKEVRSDDSVHKTDYSYNNRNQLVTETTAAGKTIYSYDANGSLVNKSGITGNETYQYDISNHLIAYTGNSGETETYTYDAEGVRRSKTTQTFNQGLSDEGTLSDEKETIWFISDTSQELSRTLAETNEDGTLLASYTWGDALLSQTRGKKTSDYLYDGHGNVRGLLDAKAKLTDTYNYNAYGELTDKTGDTENHYLYTGEYYDSTSGLYYLRARYMNPASGIFISMDSYQGSLYEPVTLHKYLYANANPVKYSDPSGMFSLAEMNVTTAMNNILQNQMQINLLGLVIGTGNATITAISGGTAEEIAGAFGMGYLAGIGAGMLICGIVIVNVVSLAMTTAVIAVTTEIIGLANLVTLSVLMLYSVGAGDCQQIMTYMGLLSTALMAQCLVYNTYGEVTVSGNKGTNSISTETLKKEVLVRIHTIMLLQGKKQLKLWKIRN